MKKQNFTTLKLAIFFAMAAVLAICIFAPKLHAQTFEGWGNSYEWDNGYDPSVAVFNRTAVEVHNASNATGPMWYRVGQVTESTITWGRSYYYDNGYNPTVSLCGSTVVEMHNASTTAGAMLYHVGHVSGSTINWGPSYYFDNGFNPSVSLSGSGDGAYVTEVHNAYAAAGPMWYHVGQLSGSTINWPHASVNYDWGFNPSVTAIGEYLVEVHNGQAEPGRMYYRVGYFDGGYIAWNSSSQYYDMGWNPKIVGANYPPYFNNVIEVHNASNTAGPMWYHWGSLASDYKTIDMGSSYYYDNGLNPSAACCSYWGDPVEVHNGSTTTGPMWYHVGDIVW